MRDWLQDLYLTQPTKESQAEVQPNATEEPKENFQSIRSVSVRSDVRDWQIFLRTGAAALGVAADRYAAGLRLRERFAVDILLLDDGFQHRRLHRDLDIVLIDAMSPFGNGELMPLGRLREPLEALARAGVLVITRTERSRIVPAIERKLRQYHPTAPIFRTEP